MQPFLSNIQFLVVIFALVLVAIVTFATISDIRRRRRTPPFLNYFRSNLGQEQLDLDSPNQSYFSGPAEWRAHNRERLQASEARHASAHNRPRE